MEETSLRNTGFSATLNNMLLRCDQSGEVGKSLKNLKEEIDALDPSSMNKSSSLAGLVSSLFPWARTPTQKFAEKYRNSQSIIDSTIKSLESGRELLKRDNITLHEFKDELQQSIEKLDKSIAFGMQLDRKLQDVLEKTPATDASHPLKEKAVYQLNQRILDIQQQLAIARQGIMAIEVIRSNNEELIKGVNRSVNVTVGALHVALTVAMAVSDQKEVLSNVQSLNDTTSSLLSNTATQLRIEGTNIHQTSSQAQINIEKMKTSFQEIRSAMEELDTFRFKAIPQMRRQIEEMANILEGRVPPGGSIFAKEVEGDSVSAKQGLTS